MLFNSFNFAIFLPVVFLLYWFVVNKKLQSQNVLLLTASYFFYACWDWRFMFLLIFSTLLDYFTGIKIHEAGTKKMKTIWLWISIGINLGFLGVFKYYNFFADSFAQLLSQVGMHINPTTINVVLPVGISFYTFQTMSYTIDVYRKKLKPTKSFINFALFVAFFPQ